MKKVRHIIFLKDVLLMAITAFGGPQAHMTLFFNVLVKKRNYISQEDLIDLNSFCQILPGPASTQTLTAVGFKIGGPKLAFLTLLVWIMPATLIMTAAAISISFISLEFTKYIIPMAVAFVMFAAYKIGLVCVNSRTSYVLFIFSAIGCYFVDTPAVFPLILIFSGFITSFKYRRQPLEEKKEPLRIEWSNLVLYASIFIGAALLGQITQYKGIRLFENFFRNGSLLFGGGEALTAMFYKEFVKLKDYLTEDQFLSGYALLKSLPGPIFSFSSYIGSLSMREYGIGGQLLGSLVATAGIFLPGTIMIFFVIRFWDRLKQYRVVKASLEGVNAASAGIVTATAIQLLGTMMQPIQDGWLNYLIILATFLTLLFTKIPPPFIIIAGIIAGVIF
ncbi:MAG: chromate efflux transporter [Cytophagaceae bacterium]|nr:chromate efflux transporter [Cytophagaceae bacterium]